MEKKTFLRHIIDIKENLHKIDPNKTRFLVRHILLNVILCSPCMLHVYSYRVRVEQRLGQPSEYIY